MRSALHQKVTMALRAPPAAKGFAAPPLGASAAKMAPKLSVITARASM
jgi:hypothetical protein